MAATTELPRLHQALGSFLSNLSKDGCKGRDTISSPRRLGQRPNISLETATDNGTVFVPLLDHNSLPVHSRHLEHGIQIRSIDNQALDTRADLKHAALADGKLLFVADLHLELALRDETDARLVGIGRK